MEKVTIDMSYLMMAAFGVLGLIEWFKSLVAAVALFAKERNWKPLVWVLLSVGFSFVVAVAGDGNIFQICSNAIFILAINEIVGYNVIVKTVFAFIDKLTGNLDGDKGTQ